MPFIVEQRRLASPLQMIKNWSEVSGSKVALVSQTDEQLAELEAYDAKYNLTGWEYRIREVKK